MVTPPKKGAKPPAPSPPASSSRPQVDWDAVERDYRAGVKTLRQMADEHGISHVAINKRAKRDGWSRDLAAKIQAKADELVTKNAVTKPVTVETKVSERDIVEANAEAIAQVRLSHRKDIGRARTVVNNLLGELEHQTGQENADLLAELGELMRKPDNKGQDKLNDLYQKIISLPGRAKTMKDLGESMRVLIALERQAFGMDTASPPEKDPLTALLHSIASGNGSTFKPVQNDPELED